MSNKKKPAVTKSDLISEIANKTELSKTQVKNVFTELETFIINSMKKHTAVTLPGLCKIYVHKKPASKSRQMKSPATGEMITVAAKPARQVVKVKAVKSLKESIG